MTPMPDPARIPDGYTYKRCDIYTPDEFRARLSGRWIEADAERYIAENPKPTYNIDDEIAVRHMRDERLVGRRDKMHGCTNGCTTKRYKFPEQAENNQ